MLTLSSCTFQYWHLEDRHTEISCLSLCTLCFEIGHFPDIFKEAHVTALWKRAGLKSNPSMYVLIALLPTLARAAEAIIQNRPSGHFTEKNLISERQAAYLKGDSTTQQLINIINLITKSWTKGWDPGIFFLCLRRF